MARLTDLAEQLLVLGAAGGAGGRCEAVGVTDDVVGRWRTGRADADLAVHLPVGPRPRRGGARRPSSGSLTNLLDNAAHYGAPPVEVTLAPAGPSWVRLLVVATPGRGCPHDLLATATQRFSRALPRPGPDPVPVSGSRSSRRWSTPPAASCGCATAVGTTAAGSTPVSGATTTSG